MADLFQQTNPEPTADRTRQKPVSDRLAKNYDDFWRIITHPAFRIGFLDACSGRYLDHDRIMQRILDETPTGALSRLGWGSLFGHDVRIAQYRYEEGRILHQEFGLRCKAWGHPDFPPVLVRAFIEARAQSCSPSCARITRVTSASHAARLRAGDRTIGARS